MQVSILVDFSPNVVWNVFFHFYFLCFFGQIIAVTPLTHWIVTKPLNKKFKPDQAPLGIPGEALWDAANYYNLVCCLALKASPLRAILGAWGNKVIAHGLKRLNLHEDIRNHMSRFQVYLCYICMLNFAVMIGGLPFVFLHNYILFPEAAVY